MLWTFEILWIYLLLERSDEKRSDENMKKKIAIMLTLILATGTFTACTAEEKMDNSSLSPTVSTSVGVSVSGETSAQTNTLPTVEKKATETTEKTTVSKETEPSEKDTKSEEKTDSGQNSATVSETEPSETVKSDVRKNNDNSNIQPKKKSESNTQKPTAKPTQPLVQKFTEKPKQKSTEKPTATPPQPPAKAKTVDINSAVNSAISYGKQLGMKYDSSLNTGNASWFSPTNASYYDSTSELTSNLKSDVEYVAYYYQSSGIAPSNLSFNVITENNKIYVVYC